MFSPKSTSLCISMTMYLAADAGPKFYIASLLQDIKKLCATLYKNYAEILNLIRSRCLDTVHLKISFTRNYLLIPRHIFCQICSRRVILHYLSHSCFYHFIPSSTTRYQISVVCDWRYNATGKLCQYGVYFLNNKCHSHDNMLLHIYELIINIKITFNS